MKKVLIIFVFVLAIQSCGSVNMRRVKTSTQVIELQPLDASKSLQLYNDHVTYYLDLSDVIQKAEVDKKVENNLRFKEYLKEINDPILLTNNLQLKGSNEAKLFEIVWKLLKEGKAKVNYFGNDVDVIELVRISDFSGEQEYFKIKDGDIFLSRIISLGE